MLKKLREVTLITLATAALLAAVGYFVIKVFSAPDDSPVEELIEDVIEDFTGVDIDLTPMTKKAAE